MASRFRWTLTNQSDSTSFVLTNDPDGWEDVSLKLKRHPDYNGVFVDFTLSLKWHCNGGGKQFIDNIYQTEDINGIIIVLIEMDCDGSGDTYTELYRGRLNLASYKTDGEFTECNIEKSDLYSKLISRDDISVNLQTTESIGQEVITAPLSDNLNMPPMSLRYENEWKIPDGYLWNRIVAFSSPSGFFFFVPAAAVDDGNFQIVYPLQEFSTFADANDIGSGSGEPFQRVPIPHLLDLQLDPSEVPITVQYEVHFHGQYTDQQTTSGTGRTADVWRLVLYYGVLDDPNIVPNTVVLFNRPGGYVGDAGNDFTEHFDIDVTGSINLNAGESIAIAWFLQVQTPGAPTLAITYLYEESTIKFTTSTLYKTTQAKTMLIHEAFNQVVDAIADKDNTFYSEFYGRTDSDKITYPDDGCGSLIAITNGLNIREFVDKNIFCTLRELFSSAKALHNIGLTIELDGNGDERIRIEQLSHFYDNATQILSLTKGVKVDVINDNSRYINSAEFGYNKWESEFNNGVDEPNSKREYSTIVNSVKGIYRQLSEYLASGYAIEVTRRRNIDITNEDWKYDNDNFFIALIRSSYGKSVEQYNDSFHNGSGMIAIDSAYNLRLTPARMLLAHIGNITACLQIIHGQIKFVKGEGNTTLAVAEDLVPYVVCPEEYNKQILSEGQSFAYNDANAANITPLWIPEIYKFEYPLKAAQLATIRANPHGYITVEDDHGNTLKGFILDVDFKLKTGMTKFELLRMYV